MKRLSVLLLVAACHTGALPFDAGVVDLAGQDHAVNPADRDGDGIDDGVEMQIALTYLPFLSLSPSDGCPVSGLAVRVTPASVSPLVMVRYAWLFDRGCDATPVAGSGGSFSLVIDPIDGGAAGIVSLRAVGREGTGCQNLSTCGRCPGQLSCATLGGLPAVWAGVGSHALYVDRTLSCVQTSECAALCTDAARSAAPPIVNVGEPGAPLVGDLTTQGFITTANGWQSSALMHYDPWSGQPFGVIASVAEMLSGVEIDPPVCLP